MPTRGEIKTVESILYNVPGKKEIHVYTQSMKSKLV